MNNKELALLTSFLARVSPRHARKFKLLAYACLMIGINCSLARAQTSNLSESTAVQISASEIVSKMVASNQKRAAALKKYTSQRIYELDYSGFPSKKQARMIVDATYKAPDKQLNIVSEEGSEILRNRVLHKLVESELEANDRNNKIATALTQANYDFTLTGTEQKDGRNCYVLNVHPKTKSKFLYEGTVWVDSEEFAVVHIQGRPAKNPSFWTKAVEIEHKYGKFGTFWLPVTNKSVSSTRLGGHAVLSINYGIYSVEPDLSASGHDISTQAQLR